MSRYSIWRIKSVIRSTVATAREISMFSTTIKIDTLEHDNEEITVKGRYESPKERGTFEIVLDKDFNPKKINIMPKEVK